MARSPKSDKVFTLDGGNIRITLPKGDHQEIELVFNLQQPACLLIGIAFANGKDGPGETGFPYVELKPAPLPNAKPHGSYRQMMVRDADKGFAKKRHCDFVLLVQDVHSGRWASSIPASRRIPPTEPTAATPPQASPAGSVFNKVVARLGTGPAGECHVIGDIIRPRFP